MVAAAGTDLLLQSAAEKGDDPDTADESESD